MARQRWGQHTRIKMIGGDVEFRFIDPTIPDFIERVDHFGRKARDLSPVFMKFWPYMQGSIWRNFDAEGRPTPWPPLADRTIEDRVLHGYPPGPILHRTGDLKFGFRANWGPRSFRIWNIKDYYWYHQLGGDKIPQRVMVILQRRDRAEFTRMMRDHLGVSD